MNGVIEFPNDDLAGRIKLDFDSQTAYLPACITIEQLAMVNLKLQTIWNTFSGVLDIPFPLRVSKTITGITLVGNGGWKVRIKGILHGNGVHYVNNFLQG